MSTEPTKLLSCIGKPPEIPSSVSKGSRASILTMAVDTGALSNRGLTRLHLPKEKEITDEMVQALLREANRELARLLRDVSSRAHNAPFIGGEHQPPSELLRRAIRCAASSS